MAHRNLSAIGETRLQPGLRLPVDHANGLAVAQIPIGGVYADDAGTKNNDIEIAASRAHAQAFSAERVRAFDEHAPPLSLA
jgi:hypothetical protein